MKAATTSQSCSGRHLLLLRGQASTRTLPPRPEPHGRRINVLQCVSASTDTSSLGQLSTRKGVPNEAGPLLALPLSRRTLLALASLAVASVAQHQPGGVAHAEEAAATSTSAAAAASAPEATAASLTEFSNVKQQYRLMVPAAWDVKGKAGADSLFEDPARRSTSVGVTVNPVKVASIEQFGGLEDVGTKLLQAEKNKESTLEVALVSSSTRVGASGATLYEYEYELDSTRGRKRILNTVTIFNSRLYILNAAFKCDKEACSEEAQRGVQLLRRVASTFDVTN